MSARRIGQRIAAGSGVLLRGLPKIVWAGEWQETIARWFLFGTTSAIAVTAMALHWWLIPVAVVGWCALAAAAAESVPEEEGDEPDEDLGEEAEDEDEPDDEPLLDEDAFRELLQDVAQGQNVHLSAVRAQLLEETGREWSGPQARALCEQAGIRVRDGVRVPGAQPPVTTGVHRDDLPLLPSPLGTPPVEVVSAGQHSNNNSNTPAVDGLVLVPDMMRKGRR